MHIVDRMPKFGQTMHQKPWAEPDLLAGFKGERKRCMEEIGQSRGGAMVGRERERMEWYPRVEWTILYCLITELHRSLAGTHFMSRVG